MPRLEYFIVCESISTDQETNRVSLFNVLEDLQVLGEARESVEAGEAEDGLQFGPAFVQGAVPNVKTKGQRRGMQYFPA